MKIRKFIAAAVFTVAATGVAAATAHGEGQVAGPEINGVDGSIAYTTALAPDHSGATVTLAAGKFTLAPDASAITVLAPDGSVAGSMPTTLQTVAGQALQVTPDIDASGTQLTLTPVNGPAPGVAGSPEAVALQSIGDAGTTVAGVLIGCGLGILIGIWFFGVGAIIGCVIGGIIGGIVGANQ
jgi:hypothetical protein